MKVLSLRLSRRLAPIGVSAAGLWTILQRDFIRRTRAKWMRSRRCTTVIVLALVVIFALLSTIENSSRQGSPIGLALFRTFFHATLLGICLLAPYTGAQSIYQERDRGTLPLLYMCHFGSGALIFGALSSSVVSLSIIVISVIPIALLCQSLGGLNMGQVIIPMLFLVLIMIQGVAAGIVCGMIGRLERHVMGFTTFLVGFQHLAIPFFCFVIGPIFISSDGFARNSLLANLGLYRYHWTFAGNTLSPFAFMDKVIAFENYYYAKYAAIIIILSSILLLLLARLLPARLPALPIACLSL